jgi:hypothetical protein
MATEYSPQISTNGLVLCLDAANPRSYVSGSTNWFNLANTTISGSLINGPTYSSANLGSIVFDGTNDWINLGTNNSHIFTSSYSISIWLKNTTTTSTNEFIIICGVGTLNGGQLNYAIRKISSSYIWYLSDGTNVYEFVSNATLNTLPTNIVFNMDSNGSVSIYVNGVLDKSSTSFYSNYVGTRNQLAISGIVNGGGASFFSGTIYQTLMYNKSLTVSEITQNFNALRGRYGI